MKKLLRLGLVLAWVLVLVGCNKQEEDTDSMEVHSFYQETDTYTLENDSLKFTLDAKTTYFQIDDKINNTVWYSNPLDGGNDEGADNQSKKYLQSTLLIEYTNLTGITTIFNNFEYSIAKQIYSIEEDGDSIKVTYSIGDVQKVFVLPVAISESRLNEFAVNISDKDLRQIYSYYRKLDINNLRVSDDKAALLELYPELNEEIIYVIRENMQEYLLVKIQDIFEAAGYTYEDYEEDNERYSGGSSNSKPFFNVSIVYRLDGDDLIVELPFEDMEWQDNYPLTKIKVLPFFGAGHIEDDGYILVPEGNGGLIRFNNGKLSQSSYYTNVFGWDDAEKRDAVVDESRATYPVFAISKNNSSLLCILEEKASAASIEADISGRSHSYNYANASYVTLHSSFLDVSAKTDKSVLVFENKKPEGNIRQRYKFLGDDSYVSMAHTYRNYLMDKHPNLVKREDTSVPISITLLGAVDQIRQKFGFPVSTPIPLTTYKEAAEITNELIEMGFDNLFIKYSGWMNHGIKQKPLTNIKLLSQLGSKRDFMEFLSLAKEKGVKTYLEGMTHYVYDTSWFDGFQINRDAAKHASRQVVKLYNFSPIYYGPEDWKDSFYLVKPQQQIKYIENLYNFASQSDAHGIAFTDIGKSVSSDFNPKNLITRDDVIAMQEEKLDEVSEQLGIMVPHGNSYTVPYADFITDMELYGNKYHILDDLVPFYSIALHGIVNYSSAPINLTNDYTEAVLRSAETGAGLSFTFMKESTSILQDSFYTRFYSTDYNLWKEETYEISSRYNNELGHIFNQYITDHKQIDKNLYVTTYEDGTKVYVNYNRMDVILKDMLIPARDYKVVGGK